MPLLDGCGAGGGTGTGESDIEERPREDVAGDTTAFDPRSDAAIDGTGCCAGKDDPACIVGRTDGPAGRGREAKKGQRKTTKKVQQRETTRSGLAKKFSFFLFWRCRWGIPTT